MTDDACVAKLRALVERATEHADTAAHDDPDRAIFDDLILAVSESADRLVVSSRERDYFRDALQRLKVQIDKALSEPEGTNPP